MICKELGNVNIYDYESSTKFINPVDSAVGVKDIYFSPLHPHGPSVFLF